MKPRLLTCVATFAALCILTPSANAQGLYAATGSNGVNGELYILDPTDAHVITDVGALKDSLGRRYGLTGMDFQPGTGILYGATSTKSPTAPGHLVSIDPSTALVTDIGSFGIAGNKTLADITFDPISGKMFGVSANDGFFASVNLLTGAVTNIGLTGRVSTSGGGTAANSLGQVYSSLNSDPGNLFLFNKTTGAASNVAALNSSPFTGDIAAMDFDSADNLFGILTDAGGTFSTTLLSIDTGTGNIILIGQTPHNLDALAFRPTVTSSVPEPGVNAVLVCMTLVGTGVFARRRFRRK